MIMDNSRNDIIEFFRNLDRSIFIDNENKSLAHCDTALPIGYGQTISQPSLVLEMTLVLDLQKDSRVLEIGTGSGYQTVLLAEFAKEVYSIEAVPQLADAAREKIEKLGYTNVRFLTGDGSQGWPEHQPYDRIIVTAAAGKFPETLIKQLKIGGKMVIPVGPPGHQELYLLVKEDDDTLLAQELGGVSFVEFKGRYGWKSCSDS